MSYPPSEDVFVPVLGSVAIVLVMIIFFWALDNGIPPETQPMILENPISTTVVCSNCGK